MIGQTVAHYRVIEKLGGGGMGEVYLAEDTRLHRRVALKVLPTAMAMDPERLERFAREAKAVGGLNHPNIVTIHAVEEAGDLRLLVMELVEGRTLGEEIPPGGLDQDRFFELAIPLADAVSAAHDRGVTHRDLKPSNVMITEDGRVKVVDFGLAKLRQETEALERTVGIEDDLTEEGRVLGTYPYMAPEQLKGKPADHRSDIFSLGVVLHEMATGRRPFDGDTSAELISAILRDSPPAVHESNPEMPRHLERIIAHCLEKDPDRRFQTAKDLRNELQSLRRELDSERLLRSTSIARRLTTGHGPRGRYWVGLGAALVVLVALVGTAIWVVSSGDRLPDRAGQEAAATGTAAPGGVDGAPDVRAPRPAVAVLFFQNLTGDEKLEWLRTGLTEMLVTDLSQSPALRVLSTDRLYQILKDAGALDAPIVSADLVQQVAQQADVGTVLLGSFAKAGDTLQVNITLQDTSTGDILDAQRVQGTGDSSIFNIVDRLSTGVLRTFERSGRVTDLARADLERRIETVTTSSVEAYQFYAEGLRLSHALKIDEAVALFKRAIELDPEFAMAYAQLAKIYETLGREDVLTPVLDQAVAHADHLPPRERYYVEATYASRKREGYGKAIDLLEEAVDLYPDDESARNQLGLLYSYVELYSQAEAEFRDLLHRGFRSVGSYNNLAQMESAQDRPEDARRLIEAWVEREPSNWSAYLTLAWQAIHWGDTARAREALNKVDELRPGSPFVDFMRWRLNTLDGHWQKAQTHADALTASKEPYFHWRGLVGSAVLALYAGGPDKALDDLDAAAKSYGKDEPLTGTSRNLAAELLLLTDRPADALAQTVEARRVAAGDWPAWEARFWGALAQQELGRPEEADRLVTELAKIADLLPGQVEKRLLHRLRGMLAFDRGDQQTALRELQTAVSMLPPRGLPWHRHRLPDHVALWYELAQVQQSLGHDDEAETLYRRVVESGTEHVYHPIEYVRSHYALGRLLEARGERVGARAAYRFYLSFWGNGSLDREQVEDARRRLAALGDGSR